MPVLPAVGDEFGRYRLTRELGRGGMGVVFAAHDASLDREVALKIIAPQLAADDDFRARFRREALSLSRIDSPHVIAVHEHGEHDGSLYLVTQLVAGGDLMQHLSRTGALAPDVAIDLTAQVLAGLADAHAAGIVHRDVKPSNVLLRPRDGRLEAVLCDFGIATSADDQVTRTGALVGSFPYMAPERHQGEPADGAADVYSVGCLLWHLLTGSPPYAGSDVEVAMAHLQAPVPQLPPSGAAAAAVNAVLVRSLAKRPEDRYPSARAMRTDVVALTALLAGSDLALPDVTSVRHKITPGVVTVVPGGATAPRRRRRGALVTAALAGVLALSGGVLATVMASDDDRPPDQVEAVVDDPTTTDPATGAPLDPAMPGATPADDKPSSRPTQRSPRTPGAVDPTGSGLGSFAGGGTEGGSGSGGSGGTSGGSGTTGGSGSSGGSGGGSPTGGSGGSGGSSSGSSGGGGTSGGDPSGGGGSGSQPTQQPTTTQPTQPPAPQPTQQPAPRPAWRCWDGDTSTTYDGCGSPVNAKGVRWVFPDIERLSCVTNGSSGDGRKGGFNCTLATGKGKVELVFMEWTTSQAARNVFKSESRTGGESWNYGRLYRWSRNGEFFHSRVYDAGPFSVRINAPTLDARAAALQQVQLRRPDRFKGIPN